ncbi:hypothetical protein ZTR_02615 [Talaromyces verruculosus]|nr:hypothetical protein ZTR_02615 [Talaromyces verruculosus]
MRSALYRDTRQMLERLELEDGSLEESYCLQRAQAWILVAVYEFMHTTFQRAWTSAGRAFRIAQLMKLNEIDSVNNLASQSFTGRDDFIELEEKRRTFWKAYCLDRFFCFLGDLPLTVNEHTIFTRLPSQETDFELGKPVLMPFLSEVMVANNSIALLPFAECIILSTIWGRIQAHQQQCLMEQAYGIPMVEFWDRHLQLENLVTQRVKLYQTNSTLISVHTDPDRLFTNLIAQAAVLSLCKIHPFTSIALFAGCEYPIAHKGEDASSKLDGSHLHDIIEALQELKNVNLLCQAQLSFWGHEISNELLD